MIWSSNLYVTPAMKKRKDKIRWKIDHQAGVIGAYLLILPSTQQNQLEIINAAYLKQRYFRNKSLTVVGMAQSRDDAVSLLIKIVDMVYKKTGTANIRRYLEQEGSKL